MPSSNHSLYRIFDLVIGSKVIYTQTLATELGPISGPITATLCWRAPRSRA